MQALLKNLHESQLVLDLGSSSGSFNYKLTPASVVAVDLSVIGSQLLTNNQRIIGDAAAIPLKSRSVDLVVCNNSLEHFESVANSLLEIKRVLKADGILWASVPGASFLDDRLYRFFFAGGGHVNCFTRKSFLELATTVSGFKELETQTLHSGFVFLRPPEPNKIKHYPFPALLLNLIPPKLLRRMVRWMNLIVRVLDTRFNLCFSRYGWAFTLGLASQIKNEGRIKGPINVCFECGASQFSSSLSTNRFLFWKTYKCPSCREINFWFSDPDEATTKTQPQHITENCPSVNKNLQEVAKSIFGDGDKASIKHWIDFWNTGPERASFMLENYQRLALIDLQEKRVLHIGCGIGGLSEILKGRCGYYVGVDPTDHIIKLTKPDRKTYFVRATGEDLPFTNQTFDYVFAQDVLEHIQGGIQQQIKVLKELKRVISKVGMIFFSTPNRLYPYEGHTRLYFPQYLPKGLRHQYINRYNPGFLREHKSFSEITSLTPSKLSRCLRESGLQFIHQLPCGADRSDYLKLFPFRGLLSYLGFGWYPHAEFWGILVHNEMRTKLRLKLSKLWKYEHSQPSRTRLFDFGKRIDFDTGMHNPQLLSGWYWHERDKRGFRWTSDSAVAVIQTKGFPKVLKIHGYTPSTTKLSLLVNNLLVGSKSFEKKSEIRLEFILPFNNPEPDIVKIEINSHPTYTEKAEGSSRKLGVMIFSLELSSK